MYQIQTNPSGTRQMQVEEEHLKTIEKYALFHDLIDSNGIVNESVLDKLKLNVQSMIDSNPDYTDLIVLCKDILYHNNMKAYGLHQLIILYINWAHLQEDLVEKEETE